MRIALVTPVLNRSTLLRETIESVLHQTALKEGSCSLDYVVVDGGSRDGSRDVAEELLDGTGGRVVSGPDEGMYDALAKGFELVDGDIFGYLNAGDLLHPRSFAILQSVWEDHRLEWVCGLRTTYGVRGDVLNAVRPYRYRRDFLRAGVYGRFLLRYMQQESCFWSPRLQRTIDLGRLRKLKAAGDYFIWHCFAATTAPAIVGAQLGGFRWHAGHLSEDRGAYNREVASFCGDLSPGVRVAAVVEAVRWLLPLPWRDLLPQHTYVQTTTSDGRFVPLHG